MSGLGLPYVVRPYVRQDLKPAAGVMYRSASLAYKDLNWHHDEAGILEIFAGRQEITWTDIQVAVGAGSVIGVMCMIGGHVDQLFVEPAWQGKGVGKALLVYVRATFPDGYTIDVFEKNQAALAFYMHLGFEVTDSFDSRLEGERELHLRWLP